MTPRPALMSGPDPLTGLGNMLSLPFIHHALLAGTAIALLSGLVGYFVVLRGQVFAGDMLSHVAYAGALGALAAGLDPRLGLFAATIAFALGIAVLAVLGRPLLFSTIDPGVARARGVPTRLVGIAFLVLLGIATGGTSQITGSMLVFALLVAPAAAATKLTARPAAGIALRSASFRGTSSR